MVKSGIERRMKCIENVMVGHMEVTRRQTRKGESESDKKRERESDFRSSCFGPEIDFEQLEQTRFD
jgi:hypothetical protein